MPSIELSGTIDPATEKWIGSALDDAADDDAPLAIIRLDTPGGLDTSMREIIQDDPRRPDAGGRLRVARRRPAASAGAFITEAADVAAMAPQTNIGSASAVTSTGGDIEGTLGRKIENDAAAFIRALAQGHGRNGALAERMVTEAENVTAAEALDADAIDIVAASEEELLAELDGYEVQGPKAQTLDTAGFVIDERDMPLQYELLQILVNPTVAYLLLLVGLVGIAIEIFSPGLFIPGTLGVVCFLLGAYGTAQLPVTAAGIALLVVGIGFIIAEAHLPTNGILGGIGVLALALSGLLLFDTGHRRGRGLRARGDHGRRARRRVLRLRDPQGRARPPAAEADRMGGDDRRHGRRPRAARSGRPGVRRRGAVARDAGRGRPRRRCRPGAQPRR